MNSTRKDILLNSLLASVGLAIGGFGIYLTIQANIGLGPWECLNEGLSRLFHISYGNVSVAISFLILLIDLIMKEKIGIGMILDSIIVGKMVDLCQYLQIVAPQTSVIRGALLMIAGMFIVGFAQFLYMKAALSCGPRDTLLVSLSRRIKKVPIGVISVCMLASVTICGWFLKAPIGIGTLLFALLCGPIMQTVFRFVHFDPTSFTHQSLLESFRVLTSKN